MFLNMKKFEKALRLQKMPRYVFAEVNERKREILATGKPLIDLGMGDCDLPTPTAIIDRMIEAVKEPANHRYPSYIGMDRFRQSIARWMDRRFSVGLDPQTEVVNLIGSKEGIAHFIQCFVNPGDFVLIPDPGYPVYMNAVILAGGTSVPYPLRWENNFKPKWSEVPEEVWKTIKMVIINFPHNPTGATVELDTYSELIEKARHYGFIVLSDNPYCEQGYDSLPPSLLQVRGAKDVAVEFFSFSKTYNMTGWRLGFACGNSEMLSALHQMKSTVDTGVFLPIQYAGIAALEGPEEELVHPSKEVYYYRRQVVVKGLREKGYDVFDGGATFYLWIRCPKGMSSRETCHFMMDRGVVVTPGYGFGAQGEGYFRISLTVAEEKLLEALNYFPNQ
jgi:LL-diaminopimelate aminotransferase